MIMECFLQSREAGVCRSELGCLAGLGLEGKHVEEGVGIGILLISSWILRVVRPSSRAGDKPRPGQARAKPCCRGLHSPRRWAEFGIRGPEHNESTGHKTHHPLSASGALALQS